MLVPRRIGPRPGENGLLGELDPDQVRVGLLVLG